MAKTIADTVHALVREGFSHDFGKPRVEAREDPEWQKLRAVGTRLWLDTGDIEEASGLWTSEFSALTTNNTLLNREIQKGIYDELIGKAAAAIRGAAPDIGQDQLLLEVAFALNAYHGLRLVEQFDANVSVELHTDLSNDVERTVAYGKRFYAVCPERFYVKVPLTAAGFLGARKLGQEGIPINFTLGFSARHNYVAALLSQPAYVNVFMGRLNAFVADNGLGGGENVGEKATLATQRALRELREEGRTETLLIGASMREGSQMASLAGLDVFTIPPKVATQYRENPSAELASQVENDPPVTLADGVELKDFNGATLWELPDDFKDCVEELLKKDVDSLTPEQLREHFEAAGIRDFLPRWDNDHLQTAAIDGKIPVLDRWQEGLASGDVGADALMNVSALLSFATDQKALDDRIQSLVG